MDVTNFLLDCDRAQARPWRVYVNGALLTQANGSNPRIKQVSITEALQISAIADRVIELLYSVRVVKRGVDQSLVRADNRWQISFDGGATLFDCRVQPPIREWHSQGVAWVVYLERGNRSQGSSNESATLVLSEEGNA